MSGSSSPKKQQDLREATIRRFLGDGEYKANVAILDSAVSPHTPRTVWGKLAGWCYGDYHKYNRVALYTTWKNNRDKIMLEMGRKFPGGMDGQRCLSSRKQDYSALAGHRPTNGVKFIKRPLSSSTINTLMHKHPASSMADFPTSSQLKGTRKRWNQNAPSSNSRLPKIDLETPKSVLVGKNLKNLINERTFMSLPSKCQQELLELLPAPDRVRCAVDRRFHVLGSKALNNEFFTLSCVEWVERLSEGDFTPENRLLLKSEDKDRCKIDEWKVIRVCYK